MRSFIFALVAVFVSVPALAQPGATGAPDPFYMVDQASINYICNGSWNCNSGYSDTAGRTVQTTPINTGVRNLVLFVLGQSNNESEAPTAYTPSNGTKIDSLNPFDGQLYVAKDPQLGTSWNPTGPGTMAFRIADTLITNNKFDRVILVMLAIGGSASYSWGLGTGFGQGYNAGALYTRPCTAMARLKAKGIVPGVNVTFAVDWGQGETDAGQGVSQSDHQTNLNQMISKLQSCGFVGRFFIKLESWVGGLVAGSAAVRAAQAAVVNGTTVFQGGDMDTISNTGRVDGTHLNDSGVATGAALEITAMAASGAPF
jgi:hypothetical protein